MIARVESYDLSLSPLEASPGAHSLGEAICFSRF